MEGLRDEALTLQVSATAAAAAMQGPSTVPPAFGASPGAVVAKPTDRGPEVVVIDDGGGGADAEAEPARKRRKVKMKQTQITCGWRGRWRLLRAILAARLSSVKERWSGHSRSSERQSIT